MSGALGLLAVLGTTAVLILYIRRWGRNSAGVL